MRKHTNSSLTLSPACRRLITVGSLPILASLFYCALEILRAAPLTEAKAAYFGGMLEYHVAAIALLTVGAFVAQRLLKSAP